MNMKKQKEKKITKQFGFKRFLMSWKNSWDGLVNAYAHEQSLYIHAITSILAIITGILLKISFNQWAIILISLVVVLAVELLNTAIEATVDLITDQYHPLAKIAKDSGSAATFVSSVAAAIICGFIFIPKVIMLFH